MKKKSIKQFVSILVIQVITLFLLSHLQGLQIQSISAAIGISAVYIFTVIIFWWLFVTFFSYFPVWSYPLITFSLSGGLLLLLGNLVPGIIIMDVWTAILLIMILTGTNGILSSILSPHPDHFRFFEQLIAKKIAIRHIEPQKTDIPGFLFLEIDGLGEEVFREAMQAGKMPTLKNLIDEGTHRSTLWQSDLSSQTGSAQAGILFGNNKNIPAYRWWDREKKRIIRCGYFPDAKALEEHLSDGKGLLANGGSSRANMFSGDAAESMLTISTVLQHGRETGPGFYIYLVNPFVFGYLIAVFIFEVLKERCQAIMQHLRRDPFIVTSRNFIYALIRAADCRILPYITSLMVGNDILRGIPVIYATYSGYDNVGHFAGPRSHEAMETLLEIDHEISRLKYLAQHAPRPYHIIVLSDHGQSNGRPFPNKTGLSLSKLVKLAVKSDSQVVENPDIEEAWDRINIFMNDSIRTNSRIAQVLRTMVRSKTHDGIVEFGRKETEEDNKNLKMNFEENALITFGSGSAGLIYLRDTTKRVTYEIIQNRYPDLILTLLHQQEIGFILIRSSVNGDLVLGKEGIYFLDNNTFEGVNPLANYPPHTISLLKRESSFTNCPDIFINTRFDPQTGFISSFENQVGHHGGLGGEQSYPFLLFPTDLPFDDIPLIGAESIHRLFKNWIKTTQGEE